MKARIQIDPTTGRLGGVTICPNHDIRFVRPDADHTVMAIPTDHPCIYESDCWKAVWTGKKWELQRKPDTVNLRRSRTNQEGP